MAGLNQALEEALPLTRGVQRVSDRMSRVRLAVRLEREEVDGYWIAACPELPGAASQGSSPEEAVANLADAVDGILRLKLGHQFASVQSRAVAEGGNQQDRTLTTTISV